MRVGLCHWVQLSYHCCCYCCCCCYHSSNCHSHSSRTNRSVITGSTDGIGKEFAYELAQKKCNIFLVSRTLSKLEAVAKDLRKGLRGGVGWGGVGWLVGSHPSTTTIPGDKFSVDVKVLAMDFTKATAQDYDRLRQVVASVPVSILGRRDDAGLGVYSLTASSSSPSGLFWLAASPLPTDQYSEQCCCEPRGTHSVRGGVGTDPGFDRERQHGRHGQGDSYRGTSHGGAVWASIGDRGSG